MNEPFDLDAAIAAVRGTERLLICPHDDPDPDALAAAWGLMRLLEHEIGAEVTIAFEGIIGRAENRAMVHELGIRLRRVESLAIADFDGVALVDTQPGASNHSVPAELPVLICVDHHPDQGPTPGMPWRDVRPDAETTAAMVLSYLLQREVEVDPGLATAVLYALKTDTRDFTREATARDLEAYAHVQPLADMELLGRIINPQLEPRYYEVAHAALETARLHGHAVVSRLPELPYPDLVAEMADWLVRRQGTDWCLCAGSWKGALRFSLRTEDPRGRAGRLAVRLVRPHGGAAGGHGMTAGGRLPFVDAEGLDRIWAALIEDFLLAVGAEDHQPGPLWR